MKDEDKTKEQLIAELVELRRQVEKTDLREKSDSAQQSMRDAVVRSRDDKAGLEGIVEALGDAISIQDTDFRVLYQNKSHRTMVGEHAGEYCYKGYQGRDSICDGCHLALSFRDGKIHKKERTRVTASGEFYYEIIASPLRNASGDIIAGIEAVRDITERKKIEAERERLLQQLKETLAKVRVLSGMLPICAWCKKVRDDKGYWKKVETYIEEYSDASFTHGICPECIERVKIEEEKEEREKEEKKSAE
jgi:transcriptional regulator with PAS, ATPase and Fis domain